MYSYSSESFQWIKTDFSTSVCIQVKKQASALMKDDQFVTILNIWCFRIQDPPPKHTHTMNTCWWNILWVDLSPCALHVLMCLSVFIMREHIDGRWVKITWIWVCQDFGVKSQTGKSGANGWEQKWVTEEGHDWKIGRVEILCDECKVTSADFSSTVHIVLHRSHEGN